jgi:Protein of unknown function (DUF4019)
MNGKILGIALILASLLCPGFSRAQLRNGELPNQEQSIETATNFLRYFDAGDAGAAYSLLGGQARAIISPLDFQQQLQVLRGRLGGNAKISNLVQAMPSSQLPNTAYRSTYLSLRFRAIYPTGAVFQDVNLELERSGQWRVIGYWFSPASY